MAFLLWYIMSYYPIINVIVVVMVVAIAFVAVDFTAVVCIGEIGRLEDW